MMSMMFKITQNTIHHFSLAETLLMAAMNEIEATQKALGRAEQSRRGSTRSWAMIVDEEQEIGPQGMSFEVVWRNPLSKVRADLRAREMNNPYCRWVEQASRIRVRRSNWDTNNNWVE
jgi:hypothetical protein